MTFGPGTRRLDGHHRSSRWRTYKGRRCGGRYCLWVVRRECDPGCSVLRQVKATGSRCPFLKVRSPGWPIEPRSILFLERIWDAWETHIHRSFPTRPSLPRTSRLAIAVGNDRQFAAFCRALGREDLARDDRFATNPQRELQTEKSSCLSCSLKSANARPLSGSKPLASPVYPVVRSTS